MFAGRLLTEIAAAGTIETPKGTKLTVPNLKTLHSWITRNPLLKEAYEKVQKAQAGALADRSVTVLQEAAESAVKASERIFAARCLSERMMDLAGKRDRATYGDDRGMSVNVQTNVDNRHVTLTETDRLELAARRARRLSSSQSPKAPLPPSSE